MAAREDQGPETTDLICCRCERLCDPIDVETCPVCKQLFCTFCTYRIGSRSYCSRACGDSFFFGGGDEEDGDE